MYGWLSMWGWTSITGLMRPLLVLPRAPAARAPRKAARPPPPHPRAPAGGAPPPPAAAAGDEGRHAGDAVAARFFPVRVHLRAMAAGFDDLLRFVAGKADAFGDFDQRRGIAEVAAVHEIGAKERVMDSLAARHWVRPAPELLREAPVVGHGAVAVRKALGVHALSHRRLHGLDVVAAPGEQVREAAPFGRRLRVQREMHPLHAHAVLLPEPLNTHGTEIAPGSDVVGEDFEDEGFAHGPPCYLRMPRPGSCPAAAVSHRLTAARPRRSIQLLSLLVDQLPCLSSNAPW